MTTVSSAPLVGRSGELTALRDAFDESRAGLPRAAVIRGEAGIGKSRLLREFLEEITVADDALPVIIAFGQCVDLGEIGAPFTPIRHLLHDLLRGVGEDALRDAAQTPGVVATLGALVPELSGGDNAGGEYIAEAIERVIENLSETHHLVLVIEDLHWADAATLALLQALTITTHAHHVTIVLTYRTDDVGRTHPMRPLLAELERNRTVTMVDLGRLNADDAAVLVRAVSPAFADGAIEAVVARSDGVPFFLEELVTIDGDELPATLRDLVLARYDALDDGTQRLLSAAALGGVRVDDDLLAQVTGVDLATIGSVLRAAAEAGVLTTSSRDGVAFRHALIQELAAAELLPGERSRLHRAYAEVLQGLVDDGQQEHAAAAAEHWLAARDVPAAFRATVAARAFATASNAPAAAVRLGERLADLWPQVDGAAELAGCTAVELCRDVSRAWRSLTEYDRSANVLRNALRAFGELSPHDEASIRRELAVGFFEQGRQAEASEQSRRGVELLAALPHADADPAYAAVLAMLAATTRDPVEAQQLCEHAQAVAERSGQDYARYLADQAQLWLKTRTGDQTQAIELMQRLRTRAPTFFARLIAIGNESDFLIRLGLFAQAYAAGEEAIAMARNVGLERSFGSVIELNVATALFGLGDLDGAAQHLRPALPLIAAAPVPHSEAVRVLVRVLSWSGDDDAAAALRAQEATSIVELPADDDDNRLGWIGADAEVALNRAESDTAPARSAALIGDAVAALVPVTRLDAVPPGLLRSLLPTIARLVSTASARGLRPDDVGALARLRDAGAAGLDDDDVSIATRALLAAETAESWADAVDALDTGFLPACYRDYARYRHVQTILAAGDKTAAAGLADTYIGESRTPAVTRWLRTLVGRPAHDADAAGSGIHTLTDREQQVLELVAEGLTNRQIGERLFISPKTASVHVSAILAKIGAGNRVEAAAMFHRRSV